jgi:NAD+ kinase
MKRIGIISRLGRPEPVEILKELLPWLKERGVETFINIETAQELNIEGYPRMEIPKLSEVVVVLGGDGTMLSVARIVCESGIPILGVNLGGLGFITEIHRADIFEAFEKVLSGSYAIEDRLMLRAGVRRSGEDIRSYFVLNDVVINKGALARMITLETSINGAYMTSFRADGLIVSTPTGSTAYCLSAGGPILYPTMESIVLIPICPHTLTNRPIVLPESVLIETTLKSPGEDVILTLDGQIGFPLKRNDTVVVEKSTWKTRLLVPMPRDFFQLLRTKLGWCEPTKKLDRQGFLWT